MPKDKEGKANYTAAIEACKSGTPTCCATCSKHGSGSGEHADTESLSDAFVDESLERIEQGHFESEGTLLSDLIGHSKAKDARAESGLSDYQSAHISARSAMRDLEGYDPNAAITRLMNPDAHKAFDSYWKSEFQRRSGAGEKTLLVSEYFEVMEVAIRKNPHFTKGEAESMVELLKDELFSQHQLKPGDILRLPYSK